MIGRIRSGGLSSGAKLDSDYADLFTLSAGRVIREQTYFNRTEALEAAGLSAAGSNPARAPTGDDSG